MARKKGEEVSSEKKETVNEIKPVATENNEIPENVDNLMRLYPYLEKLYVTPMGFVHSENAPKYLTDGATLYTNKYYKK